MKNYIRLFLIVFLLAFVFITSCSEDNIAVEYFEVKKDGKLWVGKPEATYLEYSEENKIAIFGVKTNETIVFQIVFSGVDTYKPISGAYTTFIGGDVLDKQYFLFERTSDQIIITEYAEESQIISGTFTITVRDKIDTTKTITFSNGKFRSELVDYR